MAKPADPLEPRFWSKVVRLNNDECWYWNASLDAQGYGQFGLATGQFGRKTPTMAKAHRIAWVLTNGEIPPGMYLCHTCDMPSCVNPSHLFLGTQSDNMRDCVAKKRHGCGTVGTPLYYTAEKRKQIFDAYKRGMRFETILDRYEISETHLLRILRQAKIPMRGGGNRKLTAIQVNQIRELYALGNTTLIALAKRFKVTPSNVGVIVRGKSWTFHHVV